MIKSEFTKAATRTNIASGDTHRTIFGKICKFFADLGSSAFSGLANNLTTTAAGYGMDARQGPVIQQKFDQINSNLANGQIQFDIQNGKGFYKAVGADAWIPFKRSWISGLLTPVAPYSDTENGWPLAYYDISSLYEQYKEVTIDNIIVQVQAYAIKEGTIGEIGYAYNPALGRVIVKLNPVHFYPPNRYEGRPSIRIAIVI